MATINATLPTLQDIVSRMNPDGSFSEIVEILTQQNAILQDAVWVEGNLPTGHQFTSRRALPSGTWRRFNEGVAVSKTRTEQVTETTRHARRRSPRWTPTRPASVGGNAAAYRAS
jgi:hypothetical protein